MIKRLSVKRHSPPKSTLPTVWVTFLSHRNIWLLVEEYRLEWDGFLFSIPQNFEFDLASVPRIFWPLISSFELSLVAPLIHDYLYRYQGREVHHCHDKGRSIDRKLADQIFLALMLAEGVTKWRAYAAYRAVRLFAPRWPK